MRDGTRVLRHSFPDGWVDPEAVFRSRFADGDAVFWLDASSGAGRSAMGELEDIVGGDGVLKDVSASLRASPDRLDDFPLGWVGWLGYEFRGTTTGEPVAHPSAHPVAVLGRVRRALEFDADRGTVTLVAEAQDWAGETGSWRDRMLAVLREAAPTPELGGAPDTVVARWRSSDEQYLAAIRACQEAIAAGDAYQLCLTDELVAEGHWDPVETYSALRSASPTHHGAFLRVDGITLLSASPEQFLEVTADGVVTTKPIKGTRPRGEDAETDAALRSALAADEKERAENLMIVDLMRNDLGRVCELGSVEVTALLEVESYAQVHQLVSTIRGRLKPGLTAVDALLACFPAGSMTGAPKISATRILDALERRPRGLYSGVFGRLGRNGSADLAMTIRSIVLDADGATIGAGGGITALSVPEKELAEKELKAAALVAALRRRG